MPKIKHLIWRRFWRKCDDKTWPFRWYYGHWSSSQYLSPRNCCLANEERQNNRLRAVRISYVKIWHCCSTTRAAGFVPTSMMVLPRLWHRRIRRNEIRSGARTLFDTPRTLSKRLLPLNTPSLRLDSGRWHTRQTVAYRETGVTQTAVFGQPCGHPRVWISPPHLTIHRPQHVLIRLSVSIPGNKR